MNTPLDIVICTTPIRPTPTDYPPLGSMAVIQSLRGAGYDPYFYDIDGLRPSFELVEKFFRERQPDVLGISAVVSTAYAYTKQLVRMVKRVSPKTRILLGGNLAASAELLHRLCGVQYCVIGEGEIIVVNLMEYLRELKASGRESDDFEALKAIRGLSFVDASGEIVFTGFELRISAGDLFEPDYSILEKYSRIENFIGDPLNRPDFARDPRTYEPHRRGKKVGTLITAKGCVARCTFCHRFDKGYRALPVEHIIRRIRYLQERYNVGFIQFGDENFGSDRRQVRELIEAIKPLDVLYQVGGVRCRSVDPQLLKDLKASGCVSLFYGMESGSQRILDVMEKNATLEHNMNAVRWTAEADLYTIYQLVLGMPGENDKTITETTEFFKKATENCPEPPINRLSVNYIQALVGTPVYEFARHKGLIGSGLLGEDAYLELIADVNAGDDTKFINFTDSDYFTVQSWRRRIILECMAHWRRKNNIPAPRLRDLFGHFVLRRIAPKYYERNLVDDGKANEQGLDYKKGGYFNLQRGLMYEVVSAYLYPLRTPILWAHLLYRERERLGWKMFGRRLREFVACRLRGPRDEALKEYKSLRKVVDEAAPSPTTPTEVAVAPMRAGR